MSEKQQNVDTQRSETFGATTKRRHGGELDDYLQVHIQTPSEGLGSHITD